MITFTGVGSGNSSFGHTALVVGGTCYSFGQKGWHKEPFADYMARNNFRAGRVQYLNASQSDEQRLRDILERERAANPPYEVPHSTCTTRARDALEEATGEIYSPRQNPLPVPFSRNVQDLGHVTNTVDYPATR